MGVKRAVTVALPAPVMVRVFPEIVATEAESERYEKVPGIEPVTEGSVTAKAASPKVFAGRVKEERVTSALATVMVKELVVAVAVLESVTLMASDEDPAAVGVPEITPVDEFSERPGGSEPLARAKVFPPDPPEVERERE